MQVTAALTKPKDLDSHPQMWLLHSKYIFTQIRNDVPTYLVDIVERKTHKNDASRYSGYLVFHFEYQNTSTSIPYLGRV